MLEVKYFYFRKMSHIRKWLTEYKSLSDASRLQFKPDSHPELLREIRNCFMGTDDENNCTEEELSSVLAQLFKFFDSKSKSQKLFVLSLIPCIVHHIIESIGLFQNMSISNILFY
jgi:hypothetical protein